MYSLMLYLKARSTLNFWRREESNINPTNSKEVNEIVVIFERRLLKGHSLMRGQRSFETRIDYTAVSGKVVQKKGKSVRDNAER